MVSFFIYTNGTEDVRGGGQTSRRNFDLHRPSSKATALFTMLCINTK